MILSRFPLALFASFLALAMFSCEEPEVTIGEGLVGDDPFLTSRAYYEVSSRNIKLEAVQANRLPLYQLGNFKDGIYGERKAIITSQVQIPGGGELTFGDFTQSQENDTSNENTIDEQEMATRVVLYMPFQQEQPSFEVDTDGDGVNDQLDVNPNDPQSDSDNDGISDADETANGTNPLDEDTDGDGVNDNEDSDTSLDSTDQINTFALDSIYGSGFREGNAMDYLGKEMNIKVRLSNFFLGDLDPNTGFLEPATYLSNSTISNSFNAGVEPFFEGTYIISNREIITRSTEENDPDTEENESLVITQRLAPGIYVEFNEDAVEWFQDNILNAEGSADLLNNANFTNYFRGITISAEGVGDYDIMALFDLTQARLTIDYTYKDIETNDADGGSTTEVVDATGSVSLNLLQNVNNVILGNAINTFVDDPYPLDISDEFAGTQDEARIFLKGGSGSLAELQLFGADELLAEEQINQIRANNWIINEANLVFHVDRDYLDMQTVLPTSEPERLYVFKANDNNPVYNAATEQNFGSDAISQFLNFDGILQRDAGRNGIKYRVRITEYLNDIIVRDSTNTPLLLSLSSNLAITQTQTAVSPSEEDIVTPLMNTITPLGTVLYGNSRRPGEENVKLRLELVYTESN